MFFPAENSAVIALYATWFAIIWATIVILTIKGEPATSGVARFFRKLWGMPVEETSDGSVKMSSSTSGNA